MLKLIFQAFQKFFNKIIINRADIRKEENILKELIEEGETVLHYFNFFIRGAALILAVELEVECLHAEG